MELLFSQVREDPMVELSILDKLEKKGIKPDVLIIGSGGCTVLTMLNNNVGKIHCIDQNLAQLYLIELKVAILKTFGTKNKQKILDFFEGRFTQKNCDDVLYKMSNHISSDCYKFWEKHINHLYNGINQSGVYEKLFVELVESGFNYKNVFSRENLIKKFGKDAVDNSKKNRFSSHFEQIVDYYSKNYKPEDNYFYYQIVNNRYHPDNLPPYFDNIDGIKQNYNKLDYINSDLVTHLKSVTPGKYKIIDVSNVTDWMSNKQLDEFMQLVYRCLDDNGYVVIRRLNGDYQLSKVVLDYFKIIRGVPIDKSHFYKEVVVGQKI